MKINNLHIRGFGKFNDFELSLSEGINIIYGPNESGKSTLMAFIKAMFYGLKGGRAGRDGSSAPIKKYQPWNGGIYGGYISFALENKRDYRLERNFDAGMVKLYDGLFNDVTLQFSGNDGTGLADALLGINETIFEKTVFISQASTKIDASSSRDLIDRISNLSQSGSEDISVKKAVSVLKDALKQHVGTDKSYTRPLDLISRRIGELHTAREAAKLQESRLAEEKGKLSEVAREIDSLEKKLKFFTSTMELGRLKEKAEILERKNDEIEFFDNAVSQCKTDIETMEKEKMELEKGFYKESSRIIPWLVAAAALILLVLGSYIFKQINPWFILPYGAVVLIAAGLLYKKMRAPEGKNNDLSQQIGHLNGRIDSTRKQQEELVKRLDTVKPGFQKEDFLQLEKQIDLLSEKVITLSKAEEMGLSATEKNVFERFMDQYSEELAQHIEALNSSIAGRLTEKRLEEARLREKTGGEGCSTEEDLFEEELQRLLQQKKLLEQKGEALNIAIDTLEEAAGYVQNKYVPVMNKVFNNVFTGITAGKYIDVRAGENLNIMLNDPGTDHIVPVTQLSGGTIDQLYLALRLAVSETVLKANERLPLIMDEPFAQYDDERAENTLKFIYEISRQQQVVIFTCKQQEVELIRNKYPCKICSLT